MSTEPISDWWPVPGDAVDVETLGLGVVVSITSGRTPYIVAIVEGSNAGIEFKVPLHTMTLRTDDDARQKTRDFSVEREKANAALCPGAVVRVGGTRTAFQGIFVVLKHPTPNGSLNLARLGGEDGRYITVHRSKVVLLDVAAIDAWKGEVG